MAIRNPLFASLIVSLGLISMAVDCGRRETRRAGDPDVRIELGDGDGDGDRTNAGDGDGDGDGVGNGDGDGDGDGSIGDGDGDGDVPPPIGPPAGEQCNNDLDCPADQVCTGAYMQMQPTCHTRCDNVGGQCQTRNMSFDLVGTCLDLGPTGQVCMAQSGNLGICGNDVNATCGTDEVGDPLICLTPQAGPGFPTVGTCARLCDPDNPSECKPENQGTLDAVCGCRDDQACSEDLMIFSGEGVCTSVPTGQQTCGADPETGTLTVCTAPYACQDETGLCILPGFTLDGGSP